MTETMGRVIPIGRKNSFYRRIFVWEIGGNNRRSSTGNEGSRFMSLVSFWWHMYSTQGGRNLLFNRNMIKEHIPKERSKEDLPEDFSYGPEILGKTFTLEVDFGEGGQSYIYHHQAKQAEDPNLSPEAVGYYDEELCDTQVPVSSRGVLVLEFVELPRYTAFGNEFDILVAKVVNSKGFHPYFMDEQDPPESIDVYSIDRETRSMRVLLPNNRGQAQLDATAKILSCERGEAQEERGMEKGEWKMKHGEGVCEK